MVNEKSSYFNNKRRRNNLDAMLFLAPAIISFILFIGFPVVSAVFLSFTKYNLIQPPKFIGLNNFTKLLNDPMANKTLLTTFKFVLILAPIHCIGALILAYFVSCVRNSKLQSTFRGIIYFPTLVTTSSVTLIWAYMFAKDTGFVNYYLQQWGFQKVPWMVDTKIVFLSIAMFSFWKFIGTTFLYYFIGLQNIPKTYYEAAKIDGANNFQIFKGITLPLLSPTIFFVIVTNLIGVLQVFDEPILLTNGGPGTTTRSYAMFIYETAIKHKNIGYGTALSMIIFGIILVITIVQFIGQKKWVVYDYE